MIAFTRFRPGCARDTREIVCVPNGSPPIDAGMPGVVGNLIGMGVEEQTARFQRRRQPLGIGFELVGAAHIIEHLR
ncbi:hypothetical protein EAH87_14750 [Sphingomonas koreensis]|nr:hypothetical protein EAH87_14750 [Sphingomonas koreensis]